MRRQPPRPALCPYTTLFRTGGGARRFCGAASQRTGPLDRGGRSDFGRLGRDATRAASEALRSGRHSAPSGNGGGAPRKRGAKEVRASTEEFLPEKNSTRAPL